MDNNKPEKIKIGVNMNLEQELYLFFRWFQVNGEKHLDKSIEKMIKIYLKSRNSSDRCTCIKDNDGDSFDVCYYCGKIKNVKGV